MRTLSSAFVPLMSDCKRAVSVVLVLALVTGAIGCGRTTEAASPVNQEQGPLEFALGDLDGRVISGQSLRGRVSVLLFATTFDIASQALAKRLDDAHRLHKPRINASVIMLEPPRNVDICRSYRDVLELSYPVLMADEATLAGRGPLGDVRFVPAWIVLRRDGTVSRKVAGAITARQLEELVVEAQG